MAKKYRQHIFDITPKIEELALKCEQNNAIEKELYTKYEVKRGLRDLNGKGVLAGLTNISDVCASKIVDGKSVPCEGICITEVIISKILSEDSSRRITRDLRRRRTCFCSANFRIKHSWKSFRI